MESRKKKAPVLAPAALLRDGGTPLDGAQDPVLAALSRTAEQYRATRDAWKSEMAEARAVVDELALAREAERNALEELRRVRGALEKERQQAMRQRERAERLAAALKDVHRALFSGNVFDLILKACLSLTGATRGLYLVARSDGRLQVRAAADVDGYPNKPLSAFVRGLCDRVLTERESFVCNGPADLAAFPPADGPDEGFQNCLVAPAVLLHEFNGVVLLADKPGGEGFDRDDVELVMSIGDQAGVALQNRHLQDELLRAYFSIVGVLADAMEAKDPYTSGHSQMVARYARRTAARLAASDKLRSECCYGGLLHDIGKIGVSDGVLNKPGKLLPEEWDLMRSHVRIGRDLLAHVPALDGVAAVVMHHHERYDGNGYPDGLRGEQIPLAARIVCVVDAYSAMISKRSYKDSARPEEARQELIRCKGTHFDPQVVDAFHAALAEPAEEDCADACGLLPELEDAGDFHHALRPASVRKG